MIDNVKSQAICAIKECENAEEYVEEYLDCGAYEDAINIYQNALSEIKKYCYNILKNLQNENCSN